MRKGGTCFPGKFRRPDGVVCLSSLGEDVGSPILVLPPSPTTLSPLALFLLAMKAILELGLCSLYHFPTCSDQHGKERGFQHTPEMLPRTAQGGCRTNTAKLRVPSVESHHVLRRVCHCLEVSSCKLSGSIQPVAEGQCNDLRPSPVLPRPPKQAGGRLTQP